LFEVLAEQAWQDRQWRLSIVGAGPDLDYLRTLVKHFHLTQRVTFTGYLSDLNAVWSNHHLLVMASRSEGTPLSLVEAMLCARPAVVTDVGGNAEWIEESQNGFVAEAASTRSFGAALERAWNTRLQWQEMGASARVTALERMDPHPGISLLELLATGAGRGAHGSALRDRELIHS
jgi:glycosyltransferase involved in cell wall biosynthesis